MVAESPLRRALHCPDEFLTAFAECFKISDLRSFVVDEMTKLQHSVLLQRSCAQPCDRDYRKPRLSTW